MCIVVKNFIILRNQPGIIKDFVGHESKVSRLECGTILSDLNSVTIHTCYECATTHSRTIKFISLHAKFYSLTYTYMIQFDKQNKKKSN